MENIENEDFDTKFERQLNEVNESYLKNMDLLNKISDNQEKEIESLNREQEAYEKLSWLDKMKSWANDPIMEIYFIKKKIGGKN